MFRRKYVIGGYLILNNLKEEAFFFIRNKKRNKYEDCEDIRISTTEVKLLLLLSKPYLLKQDILEACIVLEQRDLLNGILK